MNNNRIFLYILIFFFISNNIYAKNKPEWLSNIDNLCDKNSICVTGSGNTLNLAKADARNNIQKVFETKISSKFNNTLISNNDKIEENTYEELNDETSGILSGINIIKTYEDDEKFYVFAKLDKIKTSNEIKIEIQKLDEKMKILLAENDYASAIKLEDLYTQRDKLSKKYLFLTNKELKEKITYDQIIKNKKNKKNNNLSYFIETNDPYDSLLPIIKEVLVKNGLNIITNKQGLVKIVKANLNMEKEHINVEGFEKYKLYLNIDILKNNKTTGFIKIEFLETGRDKKQIYNKSIEKIKKYIEENFEEFIN